MKLYKKKEIRLSSIYSRSLITRNISLPIINFGGDNIHATIEKYISMNFEGKCVVEGFIKPQSTKIITYSSGIVKGISIQIEVVFECQICCPVEGMLIQCVAKNITKAGIRADSSDESPSPVVVFITRDHHYNVDSFSNIKEGDMFEASVIGQRFELNDKFVSIIGELVKEKPDFKKLKQGETKAKLVFED